MSVILFVLGIPTIIILLIMMGVSCVNQDTLDTEDWINKVFNENDINQDDIKILLKKELSEVQNKQLVYTNDQRLFYLEVNKSINQINIANILRIDINCECIEKNVKRIIALTTTFDNIKSIVSCNIKIITDNEILNVEIDTDRDTIDKANQFKLLIDRELELLNK